MGMVRLVFFANGRNSFTCLIEQQGRFVGVFSGGLAVGELPYKVGNAGGNFFGAIDVQKFIGSVRVGMRSKHARN